MDMPTRNSHRLRSRLAVLFKALAFSLVAVAVAASALVPDRPAPVNLERTLLTAPPGRWTPDTASSGPLDREQLARRGASAEAARKFTNNASGYSRVWIDATQHRAVQASIFDTERPASAGRFLVGVTDGFARQGARTFAVPDIDGARGFVVADSTRGISVTQVAFRRGRLAFLVGVVAAGPQPALARTLAFEQERRAPAGETGAYDEADAMGLLVGTVIGALAVYLFIINGRAGLRRRRRRARMGDAGAGESRTDLVYADVSDDVRLRRRTARAAFTAKSVGAAMILPVFGLDFWPDSLLLAGPGIALFACAVGLERGRRLGAVGLLVLAAALTLTIIGIPLAVIMSYGVKPVLRGGVGHDATRSRGSRYRRLFTGRRKARVVGLLVVAATLTAIGLVALVASALTAAQGGTAARQALGALACLGLAVLPYRRARRHAAPEARSVIDDDSRAPILYLRSFGDDRLKVRARGGARRHSSLERFGSRRRQRFEEVIAGCLWQYGPVIAVSEPGEQLAPLGGARMNFVDAEWQDGVETWIGQAGLVVISLGRTSGLAWEISRVAELGLWHRTIILFPPLSPAELEARWRFFVDAATSAGTALPADLEATWVLTAVAGEDTLVAYQGLERDEWHYESAINNAAHSLLSRHLEPAIAV